MARSKLSELNPNCSDLPSPVLESGTLQTAIIPLPQQFLTEVHPC